MENIYECFPKPRNNFFAIFLWLLFHMLLVHCQGFHPVAVEENKGFSSPGQCAQGFLDCHFSVTGKGFVCLTLPPLCRKQ